MDWAGLGWTGLDWPGLGWTGVAGEVGREYLETKLVDVCSGMRVFVKMHTLLYKVFLRVPPILISFVLMKVRG